MKKIAVIFPGIGYHCDKPLLYYGKKLAREQGYEIIEVTYGGFPYGIKGDPQKMYEVFESALSQAEEKLDSFDFTDTKSLIISKSVGTVVAAAWQKKHNLPAKNIFFTPVEGTFQFAKADSGIVFHGTGDDWVKTEIVIDSCEKLSLPLYLTEGANHSMEIGENTTDLATMTDIMNTCQKYIKEEL